jgi:hypothetical protein
MQILKGVKHPLKLGYFATKLLSPTDLEKNLSFVDARAQEKTYFETMTPWNGKEVEKNRLGVGKLTEFLSKKLSEHIGEQCVLPFSFPLSI